MGNTNYIHKLDELEIRRNSEMCHIFFAAEVTQKHETVRGSLYEILKVLKKIIADRHPVESDPVEILASQDARAELIVEAKRLDEW